MLGQRQTRAVSGDSDQNQPKPLMRIRGLKKTYQTAAGGVEALRGIDLDIFAGEFVAIVGKSGAGKTTLVNMITGVDNLTAGEIWIGDTPVHRLDENQLALWRGRTLGIVYQSFYLMPTLSLLDNVMLPMEFCNLFDRNTSPARAMQLLEQVELADHAFKMPAAISGGQQQRVAIARALANDPAIVIADEPTGRLDSGSAEVILQIFENIVRQGKTLLIATHDQSLARRATRTIHLVEGRIADEGAPRQVIGLVEAPEAKPKLRPSLDVVSCSP